MEYSESMRLIIGEGGRVVIPAAFRKALGIKTGDEVIARIQEGELRLGQQQAALRQFQEAVRGLPHCSVDDFLAFRREDGN